MDFEKAAVRPLPTEHLDHELKPLNAALVGDFVVGILKANRLFGALTSEVGELDDKDKEEQKRVYVRFLLAACAGEARGKPLSMKEMATRTGLESKISVRKYLTIAVKAEHLREEKDPADARRTLVRASDGTMAVFFKDMGAVVRIAAKLVNLDDEEVRKLEEALEGSSLADSGRLG